MAAVPLWLVVEYRSPQPLSVECATGPLSGTWPLAAHQDQHRQLLWISKGEITEILFCFLQNFIEEGCIMGMEGVIRSNYLEI